jgi:hypothetical protein
MRFVENYYIDEAFFTIFHQIIFYQFASFEEGLFPENFH